MFVVNKTASGATRVNITTAVNASAIRNEKRNGRDVIVVPSATLPDNIVMNNILYPADEIANSFMTLERKPAPLDHPMVNGEFVSALDPEGINRGWIGAWNENVRQVNGRVFLDKIIDVQRANESEGGRRVLNAIAEGKPIHTSTGLLCNLEKPETDGGPFIARNMQFDHDAILLDFDGAATPEQGVGIFVNKGSVSKIQVVNSLYDAVDSNLDWVAEDAIRALERRQKIGLIEKLKAVLIETFGASQTTPATNEKEDEMSKEAIDALAVKVNELTTQVANMGTSIGEAVGTAVATALKPLTDAHNAQAEAAKATAEAEKAEMVGKVVAANLLTEEAAKAADHATLKALVANIKVSNGARPLNTAFNGNQNGDISSAYKVPKAS